MKAEDKVLMPCGCWPNLHYFLYFLNAREILIEQHDHFEKQTYRNRYELLTANGVLPLTVPIHHTGSRQTTRELKIFYGDRWQARHWGALTSGYRRSPYFEFFEDEFRPFYHEETENLLDYNLKQLDLLLKILRIQKEIKLTDSFQQSPATEDLRFLRFAEKKFTDDEGSVSLLTTPYYQTFGSKFDFVPNLSMLDLLFNTGLKSLEYFAIR
jgi:hypothetical protein